MKRRTKKLISMFLLAAMTVSTVSGCGGGSEKAASDNSGEKKSITVSVQSGDGVQQGWEAVAAAYEELHPDVDVVVDLKPVDGYADWVQKVFTADDPTAELLHINLVG